MERARLPCSRRTGILPGSSTENRATSKGKPYGAPGRQGCGGGRRRVRDKSPGRMTMSTTFDTGLTRIEARPLYLAVIAGLAFAFVIGRALPSTMEAISAVIEPLCASSDPAGSTLDTVEPIGSYALPNVPGKRVTIVRVFYGPGGFTRAHRHAGSVTAYITKGRCSWRMRARSSRHSWSSALKLSRHPEVRALRCTCTAGRASKDGPRAVLILRGAQASGAIAPPSAPQDDG